MKNIFSTLDLAKGSRFLAFFAALTLAITGCTLFDTQDDSPAVSGEQISGTVTFPDGTQVASIKGAEGIRGAVNFTVLKIYINGVAFATPDANGNYSASGVTKSSEYKIEVKNSAGITLLKSISTSSGTGNNINVTTTAVAVVVLKARETNSTISVSSVSITSSAIQSLISTLETVLKSATSLSSLTSSQTDITLLTTVQTAATTAVTQTLTGTTTTTTTTTSTTTTTTSTTTSTTALGVTLSATSTSIQISGTTTITAANTGNGTLTVRFTTTGGTFSATSGTGSSVSTVFTAPASVGNQTITATLGNGTATTTANITISVVDTVAPTLSSISQRRGRIFTGKTGWVFNEAVSSATVFVSRTSTTTTSNTVTLAQFNGGTKTTTVIAPSSASFTHIIRNLSAVQTGTGTQQYWVYMVWQDSSSNKSSNTAKIASFSMYRLASWTTLVAASTGRGPTNIATGSMTNLGNASACTITFNFPDEVTTATMRIGMGTTFPGGSASTTTTWTSVASVTQLATSSSRLYRNYAGTNDASWSLRIWYRHGSNGLIGSASYNMFGRAF